MSKNSHLFGSVIFSSTSLQTVYEKSLDLVGAIVRLSMKNVDWIINNYSMIETKCVQLIEFSFGPKQIFYYILIIIGLQSTTMTFDTVKDLLTYIVSMFTNKGRKKYHLTSQLNNAKSYDEWLRIALDLDRIRGFDEWRMIDVSNLYDYRVLRKRILDTIQMINQGIKFHLCNTLKSLSKILKKCLFY